MSLFANVLVKINVKTRAEAQMVVNAAAVSAMGSAVEYCGADVFEAEAPAPEYRIGGPGWNDIKRLEALNKQLEARVKDLEDGRTRS